MPKDTLDEREFELINIIGPSVHANQRDLSRQMELSLGMINMLIRRLMTKGFIRTRQLNQKKVQYILTPKGFAEKMRKSVKYTMKTVNSIENIKKAVEKILCSLYESGERDFIILGGSDFSLLVKMVLRDRFPDDYRVIQVDDLSQADLNVGIVLVCQENVDKVRIKNRKNINLVEELAKQVIYQ